MAGSAATRVSRTLNEGPDHGSPVIEALTVWRQRHYRRSEARGGTSPRTISAGARKDQANDSHLSSARQPDALPDNHAGRLTHGEVAAGDAVIMLASPTQDYESPRRHRESCGRARKWSAVPWMIDGVLVYVDNLDAHFQRAKSAGAQILSETKRERRDADTVQKIPQDIAGFFRARPRCRLKNSGTRYASKLGLAWISMPRHPYPDIHTRSSE